MRVAESSSNKRAGKDIIFPAKWSLNVSRNDACVSQAQTARNAGRRATARELDTLLIRTESFEYRSAGNGVKILDSIRRRRRNRGVGQACLVTLCRR
jgi:hypothetical protein